MREGVSALPRELLQNKLIVKQRFRDHRLHRRWEFLRFFEKPEVFRTRTCLVFRVPNQLGHYRLGITFKTKAGSVERNRVRRAIREAFRVLEPRLEGFDYNVVIPPGKTLSHPYPIWINRSLLGEFKDALVRC